MRVKPMPPEFLDTMDEADSRLAVVFKRLFYFSGALAFASVFSDSRLLIPSVVFATLGVLLWRYQSRAAALAVAVLAAVNFVRVLISLLALHPTNATEFVHSGLGFVDGLIGSAIGLLVVKAHKVVHPGLRGKLVVRINSDPDGGGPDERP